MVWFHRNRQAAATPQELALRRLRIRNWSVIAVLAAAAAIIVIGIVVKPPNYWPIVTASALSALLAISELVTRYRDDPTAAVLSTPAVVYVAVNVAAALGALYLIHVFGLSFGAKGTAREVTQVLVAGLGSAALFRTSLFNVSVGDEIIGIGPSAILSIILAAADRAVDRQRAVIRAVRAEELMKGISFSKNADELLAYCVATLQNVAPSEAKAIENRISDLQNSKNDNISDTIKSYILGLDLLTLVGDQVLEQATVQIKAMQYRGSASVTNISPESAKTSTTESLESKVLATLDDAGGTMSIQQLREAVGLELEDSLSLLSDLQKRGLLAITGKAGAQTVHRTSPE